MLTRAITLLEQVGAASAPVGVSALARKTDIPKTTAYRILENLTRQALLSRREGGYVTGPRMRQLARLINGRLPGPVRDLLRPYLVELCVRTGEAVTLGVLDGTEMVIVETVRGLRHASLATPARRTPAHCSAIGKLLMAQHPDLAALRAADARLTPCTACTITDWARLSAQLSHIRQHGIAISNQEHVSGVIDIAMPVLGRRGPIAGISLSHAAGTAATQDTHTAHRQITAAASAALRALPPPPRCGPLRTE